MIFQKISKPIWGLLFRNNSTNGKFINVCKDKTTGVSLVSMNKPPANGLTPELLVELRECLLKAQQNDSTGVIITSSLSNIFSCGLDIKEIYKPDMIRIRTLWNELQETWLTLYGLEIPTAAAINCACPGGGCAVALSCEYRVLVKGDHKIGLNEVQVGVLVPVWLQSVLIDTIGTRQAEKALLKGTLFSPQEALEIGLIDELAIDKDDAISKCQEYIVNSAKIPTSSRVEMKKDLHREKMTWLQEHRDADTTRFVISLTKSKVQSAIGSYKQRLEEKKITD